MSNLKLVILGGLDGIGKNMMAFEYGEDIVIVDAGMMFPDDDMLGIDKVIPDYTYVRDNRDRIKALVLTHGHEDHIGAIRNLFMEISVPIYATKFTLMLAKSKLRNDQYTDDMLNEVLPGEEITIGEMAIEFVRVCHSIPDGVGLAIKTPVGTIVHTGDFKVDYTPIDGEVIDLNRFAELGNEGVLALLSDSTNADSKGTTMSERVVGENFEKIFGNNDEKRIIIVSFASNIHRIQQAISVAAHHGRKVCIIGRSMEESVALAKNNGYLECPEDVLVPLHQIKSMDPHKTVIITTGSQGERMSVISRMAREEYKGISINEDDCVVLSSAPIPGNEKGVQRVINNVCRRGAHIVYEQNFEVHVSGHACSEELRLVTSLVKPKFLIPIHGEYRHLEANSEIGQSLGIPKEHVFILDNGDILEFTKDTCELVDHVPGEAVLLDGLAEDERFNIVQSDRRRLSRDGILIVSFAMHEENKELLSEIKLNSRGFIYMKEDPELKADLSVKVNDIVTSFLADNVEDFTMKAFKKSLMTRLADYIYTLTKRRPIILPVIIKL